MLKALVGFAIIAGFYSTKASAMGVEKLVFDNSDGTVCRATPTKKNQTDLAAVALAAAKPHCKKIEEAGPKPRPQVATWYGPGFEGNKTACGDIFRGTTELTIAVNQEDLKGKKFPNGRFRCGDRVLVTNLANGRTVEARVTDTGGLPDKKGGTLKTIIDGSTRVATTLGYKNDGFTKVAIYNCGQ